jgi:D-aminoacyl-tRNA deacylase
MKLIIQRVSEAHVMVENEVVGAIGSGLFVLLGIKTGDSKKEADVLSEKLTKLRIMEDDNGKMNLSVKDVEAQVLVVSQFTLYSDTKGGNRPSFTDAARPEEAEPLYEYFIEKLRGLGMKVSTGKFGAYMEITAELDGPVTIVMEV